MLFVDKNGLIDAERIIIKRFSTIERGKLDKVNGIIVHQTHSHTAESTFNSYKSKTANGAHFLIAKDGQIYQTASIYKVTWHVGKSQSRCFLKHKCEPAEFNKITQLEKSRSGKDTISRLEHKKPFPARFPFNMDSIGIEIVGFAYEKIGKEPVYEPVNEKQNESLKWLVKQLSETLGVSTKEIYRHPEVGRKNETEASTARW